MSVTRAMNPPAVLDAAPSGDIEGALGTIRQHDVAARCGWRRRVMTLLAILGPGLIVMVGDNDAGAFATYAQAGQDHGTALLWTLLLLVPVLYVNQEMVLRLGAVSGVGHARLILERFGRFWGAFSVIDLLLLNALTIVTEFIGISLALDYLGVSRLAGVTIAAALTVLAASTGSFRRFERFALTLCAGTLLLVPIFLLAHPPLGVLARDFAIPRWPAGNPADVMLLVIGIVGTTVAPWQMFFQQSYVIDKRITPRFLNYERADLWIGIVVVVLGAAAMMAFCAAAFSGTPEAGQFSDVRGVAAGLGRHVGHGAGVLFALALIDASVIGAAAVSLASAYAIGDVLSLGHSLHRRPAEAVGFHVVYAGLIAAAAALVLMPGAPLGLITAAVQTLAGVLLPSASVFLLLLCNDPAVLGPWVNGRWLNLFTGAVVAVLVLLSLVLTAAVLFPAIGGGAFAWTLGLGLAASAPLACIALRRRRTERPAAEPAERATWRMPPLPTLPPAVLSPGARLGLLVLRAYLIGACLLVALRVAQLALGKG